MISFMKYAICERYLERNTIKYSENDIKFFCFTIYIHEFKP
jgi:hypothetical protein